MSKLPDSYIQAPNKVKDYLNAMLDAQAPDRFSQEFLSNLGFKSTNDRAWISVLKELNFLDADAKPTSRYYDFLDRTQWKKVLAQSIKEAFEGLFLVNIRAYNMSRDDVKNKLRSLYQGQKNDRTIELIATTFDSLVKEADFEGIENSTKTDSSNNVPLQTPVSSDKQTLQSETNIKHNKFESLVYQINIVLPSTRDQSVYDAIFKSLREHLG